MLAPSLLDVEEDIAETANTLRRIGAFSESCLSAQLGQILPAPSWLDEARANLADCRAIATGWLNARPDIISPVVVCFTTYAAGFAAVVDATRASPDKIDADTWAALLIDLRDRARANSDAVALVRDKTDVLHKEFAAAHQELRDAMAKAREAEEDEHADIAKIAGKLADLFERLKQLDAGSSAAAMAAGETVIKTVAKLTYTAFTAVGAAIPYLDIAVMLFSTGHSLYTTVVEDEEIERLLREVAGLMVRLNEDVQALAVTHALIAMLDSMNEAYVGAAQQLPRLNSYWDAEAQKIDIVLQALRSEKVTPDDMTEIRSLPTALKAWQQLASVAGAMALEPADEGRPVTLTLTPAPTTRKATARIQGGTRG